MNGLWLHLRGHALMFEPRAAARALPFGPLLLAALVMEVARLIELRWLYGVAPLWLLLPVLLAATLIVVPRLVGASFAELGFKPWRAWTVTERSYFIQVLVLANLVFLLLFSANTAKRFAGMGVAAGIATVFVPFMFYGFYQEVVYRGLVQTALVGRWGAPFGIVVANALYAFGPLHASYFSAPASFAVPMFAAIFGIGLFFGLLFQRSGNLWLAALFHAIGNAYMVSAFG